MIKKFTGFLQEFYRSLIDLWGHLRDFAGHLMDCWEHLLNVGEPFGTSEAFRETSSTLCTGHFGFEMPPVNIFKDLRNL